MLDPIRVTDVPDTGAGYDLPPKGLNKLSAILLVTVLLFGCSNSRYVLIDAAPPQRAVDSLAVGDNARILTTDGREVTMIVASVEQDAVVGEDERVPVEDIASIAILLHGEDYDYQVAAVSRVVWAYALVGYLVSLAL